MLSIVFLDVTRIIWNDFHKFRWVQLFYSRMNSVASPNGGGRVGFFLALHFDVGLDVRLALDHVLDVGLRRERVDVHRLVECRQKQSPRRS